MAVCAPLCQIPRYWGVPPYRAGLLLVPIVKLILPASNSLCWVWAGVLGGARR
jgi:hypothetical protein